MSAQIGRRLATPEYDDSGDRQMAWLDSLDVAQFGALARDWLDLACNHEHMAAFMAATWAEFDRECRR